MDVLKVADGGKVTSIYAQILSLSELESLKPSRKSSHMDTRSKNYGFTTTYLVRIQLQEVGSRSYSDGTYRSQWGPRKIYIAGLCRMFLI